MIMFAGHNNIGIKHYKPQLVADIERIFVLDGIKSFRMLKIFTMIVLSESVRSFANALSPSSSIASLKDIHSHWKRLAIMKFRPRYGYIR